MHATGTARGPATAGHLRAGVSRCDVVVSAVPLIHIKPHVG